MPAAPVVHKDPAIVVGIATKLGVLVGSAFAAVALISAILKGDHSKETITALIAAVAPIYAVIRGRMDQATAHAANPAPIVPAPLPPAPAAGSPPPFIVGSPTTTTATTGTWAPVLGTPLISPPPPVPPVAPKTIVGKVLNGVTGLLGGLLGKKP